MVMNFEFTTSSRIIFGCGSVANVPAILEGKGHKILLVTGKNQERAKPLTDKLPADKYKVFTFSVVREPTTEIISEGVQYAREKDCELIIGFGGGSVIDSAKAIAALVPNKGELMDYLEVIGKGRKLESNPLTFIAIPTTAGTGAEATKNAVIHSPEHNVKVSLRSPLMFPEVAVVDPELTLSMPPEITASTGMDALTHLLETFVSNQSNPFIDNLCREGMKRVVSSLKRAYDNGNDIKAREDMAFSSLLGGMALANVKLGAVHGFAGPMGGMFPVPHGAICALLLPAVMEVNIRAVTEQKLDRYYLKFKEVAKILTGNSNARAGDGIRWAAEMVKELKIPSLSDYGITEADFPVAVEKAKRASSMKGNPVVLSDNELKEILERSY
jgi:alcohol dehydrogenase class IV